MRRKLVRKLSIWWSKKINKLNILSRWYKMKRNRKQRLISYMNKRKNRFKRKEHNWLDWKEKFKKKELMRKKWLNKSWKLLAQKKINKDFINKGRKQQIKILRNKTEYKSQEEHMRNLHKARLYIKKTYWDKNNSITW